MGTPFSIVHDFDCDAATYWEIFWDDAFNAELYPATKCGRKLISQKDEGAVRIRDQEVTPERDIPAIFKKFLPAGAMRYVEHGVFKKPAGPHDVEVRVPTLGDRFVLSASYQVADTSPGHCRRTFAGECTVKIPLVGGKAERTVNDGMKETYDIAARVHREWISRRKSPK
jgi:hypothetical protein